MGAAAHDNDQRVAVQQERAKQLLDERLADHISSATPSQVITRSVNGYRASGTRVTEIYDDGDMGAVLQVFMPTNGTPTGQLMLIQRRPDSDTHDVIARYTAEGTGDTATVVTHSTNGATVNLGGWEDDILDVLERSS